MILDREIIGLDLGASRSGVARINIIARMAEPLPEIDMQKQNLSDVVDELVKEMDACAVVVGLPRGLDGQETEQTRWAMRTSSELEKLLTVPVFAIDEAVTTKLAEKRAEKGQSVDSVAACIILEDFVEEVANGRVENVTL